MNTYAAVLRLPPLDGEDRGRGDFLAGSNSKEPKCQTC